MTSQEQMARITLRLPGELHRALTERAGSSSLNALIVELLQAGIGSDETAAGFHFLDAISPEISARARVVARLHLAAATKVEATDVVLIDPELNRRIVETTGDEYRSHDAALRAINDAFPAEGTTWGEIADALGSIGPKAPKPAQALRDKISNRLAAEPAIAGRVAI